MPTTAKDFQELAAALQAMQPALQATRRALHRRPERSMAEHQTALFIEKELDALRLPHRRVGATGVLAVVQGARPAGPGRNAVALRADIDALPLAEETGAAYRSEVPGVMHACGHDAHTACLLGAAALLAKARPAFGGEVRLVFQPGEETGGGAPDFLAAGVMQGVDRVFGLHVAPDLPLGVVGLKPGLNNAGVDRFRVTVRGKAAHVSAPQLGADALYIASQLTVALQALVTRRVSPTEPALVGIGTLHAGAAYNAVADSAVLEGTTRTVAVETRQNLRRWIAALAESTAAGYGGAAECEITGIAAPLYNDAAVCGEAAAMAGALFGGRLTVTDARPLSLAGDNFSEFLQDAPGAYAYLGTADAARPGTCHAIHTRQFDLAEEALAYGAGLYAGYALWFLGR